MFHSTASQDQLEANRVTTSMSEFKSEPVRVPQHARQPSEELATASSGDDIHLEFREVNAPASWDLRGTVRDSSVSLLDDYRTEIRKYRLAVDTREFHRLILRVRYDRQGDEGHLLNFVTAIVPPFSEIQHREIEHWSTLRVNP